MHNVRGNPKRDQKKGIRAKGRAAVAAQHEHAVASRPPAVEVFSPERHEKEGVKYLRELLSGSPDNPLLFLLKIVSGRQFMHNGTMTAATLDQRVEVALKLANKILPDLKATELTGKDGGPIETSMTAGDKRDDDLLNELHAKIDHIAYTQLHSAVSGSEVCPPTEGASGGDPQLDGEERPLAAALQLEVLGSA